MTRSGDQAFPSFNAEKAGGLARLTHCYRPNRDKLGQRDPTSLADLRRRHYSQRHGLATLEYPTVVV